MVTSHSDLCAADGRIDLVLLAMSTIIAHGKSLPASISRSISKSMDELTAAKGNLLVPGETTDVVTGYVRFLSSSGFLSQAEGTTYGAPQTSLEKFLRAPLAKMTFSQRAVNYSQQTLTNKIISYPPGRDTKRNLKIRRGSGSASDDGGDGAVVQVSVSQSNVNYLPGRSPNTTAMKVTLSYDSDPGVSTVVITIPNSSPIPYYDIKPQNGSVACKKTGRPYSVSANCSAAPDINVTCPGNDTRKLKFICPGKKLVPVCLAWNGEDYADTNACTVIAYTPYNTTCACVGDTGYNEALGEPASNNPQIDSIAATADIEVSQFVDTWKSAESITPNSLTKNKVRSNFNIILCQFSINIILFA